ncbi:proline--tRNA ligase [Limosilactobacillus reuteri]|jgi:prolyl-tRNA synthetase|uniref:Proline--tRNA ligase n=3 Tax=Limosilactobacillus reuteri TaxID=1598 RepID=A0A1V4FMV1_LIMRT|nr:proline--tRNA ligase [Limosilactobacillus reuteri]CCC03014.1 prolyl-tRNA synthase [Limosilactobacillus reuteri subsp. suis]AGN99426.1 prolyl-tRNA synthase [Limosilactobacillus reuteri I5007]MCC4323473.1 proline--tRNA ligase [Limosilactobacillus reuteri]MCC4327656.1 proline--tRNA ligase [Limosilactobacillus reuteri]MCC4333769.1 proline--tRNA ligase [Limosilactobacillus reuteri]
MKQSKVLIPTKKEAPSDAEALSHKMMIRAGYIYQVSAGVWSYLPLAYRVIRKVENIIRDEMDKAGAVEMLMPGLLPADLWKESGRYESYGDNLFKLKDRRDRDFILGPTHEETFTEVLRDSIKSYKKLPLVVYQLQDKFRDEDRPRYGILRGKEFEMLDGYSFSADQEGLDEAYNNQAKAYRNIFDRIGLNYKVILADSGTMGGKNSQEFSAPAEVGEDIIAYTDGDYAANIEKAESKFTGVQQTAAPAPIEKKATPGAHTVDEAAESLDLDPNQVIKSMLYIAKMSEDEYQPVLVLMRGNDEVNDAKVTNALDCEELELATEEDAEKYLNAHPGSLGPVGVGEEVKILADNYVKVLVNMACGANEDGYHYVNANIDRDFRVDQFGDFRNVKEGEIAPDGQPLKFTPGIEIGHIFKLGTHYSSKLGAQVLDSNGRLTDVIMGSYGIGVTRLLSAVAEQNADENGLVWPDSIAPFDVHVIPVNAKKEDQMAMADKIDQQLTEAGYEVLVDDRKERAGVKFADSDLIGIPIRVTVGKKAQDGIVEIKIRKTGETVEVKQEELVNTVGILLKQLNEEKNK